MPHIDLLEPTVFMGLVQELKPNEELYLTNKLPRTPSPDTTATWDVIESTRMIARPNVPNSEAHIVPRMGRTTRSTSFLYLREKKVFLPTTIRWLRAPGQQVMKNAEQAVMREVSDLNSRFDIYCEMLSWQALSGKIDVEIEGATVTVDYAFRDSHKLVAAKKWGAKRADDPSKVASIKEIIADIREAKRRTQQDARVMITEAWTSDAVMDVIIEKFAQQGAGGFGGPGPGLSDRQRDQYYNTGVLPGFQGLNWMTNESVYDDASDAVRIPGRYQGDENLKRFLNEDRIIFGNFTDNRPMEIMEGPSADHDAPEGYTGRFAKSWIDPDPSNRQYLIEWHMMPIITRPDQFVILKNVIDL